MSPEPEPEAAEAAAVGEFVAMMRHLRVACAWKRGQTHRSLVRHLLEEAWETVDAIDLGEESGDWSHLADELGDLLLQVVFHALIAEERGEFDLDTVAAGISAKMRRRNPHVFGPQAGQDLGVEEIEELWQAAKAREKAAAPAAPADAGPLAGLPTGLPALILADKALARLGGIAPVDAAGDPVDVEIGERLLALVAEARAAGVDAEQALRDAVRRRA